MWQQTHGKAGAAELRDTLKDFPLGTIQYAGGGTERCWKREHWNGLWNAKADELIETIKESGHPIVDPEPIYLKGDFDGAHFKSDETTREALCKGICLLTRWGQFYKLLIEGEKVFRDALLTKRALVHSGDKPRVTAGDATATNLLRDRIPTYAEGNVMDLMRGLPRAEPSAFPEATPEQAQLSFFESLVVAETHYFTTDSEVMQRREVPSACFLMMSFPQSCIFFYVNSEKSTG